MSAQPHILYAEETTYSFFYDYENPETGEYTEGILVFTCGQDYQPQRGPRGVLLECEPDTTPTFCHFIENGTNEIITDERLLGDWMAKIDYSNPN